MQFFVTEREYAFYKKTFVTTRITYVFCTIRIKSRTESGQETRGTIHEFKQIT